jgi:hypothetical protein
MIGSVLLGVAWFVIAITAFPACGGAQSMPATLSEFLQRAIGLTPGDLRAVEVGTPVVRAIDPPDPREIAVVGVVRIEVPRAFYVRRAADFPSSLRDSLRLRFATFSDPPAETDVAALSLPHADVKELAHCDSGSCKLKLSNQTIADLRASIDPNSPAADSIASAYLRRRALRYVTEYRERGNAALIVYDDQPAVTAAAAVWDAMLSRSPFMYQYAPSLERYLKNYPQDRPADVREVLFWSEDNLPGLKPTISITHEMVYAPPELPGSTFIVSKQLYADHYLDGALDLTAVVDLAGSQGVDTTGLDLVFLRRWHFDDLPSGGLLNLRGKAKGKLRDGTEAILRGTKVSTEQAYAALSASGR